MAQLYKMTLYICDLEESLSFDEIEILIDERALSGISVNALCHFADEQIGEQIEWDDDVDLNRCDCPTSAWDKYFKPMTNADRIRSMSDEELADKFTDVAYEAHGRWYEPDGKTYHSLSADAKKAWLNWLRQPVKDGDSDGN